MTVHLKSLKLHMHKEEHRFPFSVPVIKSLEEMDFTTPVTFFVGENGSGKSTLIEAIACAVGSITVGSESVRTDPTLKAIRELSQTMRLTWSKRTRKGFFLRAEDFFAYAKQVAKAKEEMEAFLKEVDETYEGRSETAKGLAKMPYNSEINAIQQRYGEGLDAQSHGESFLLLFQSRFVPGGLYLLDEPEAPLSPISQLGFIAIMKHMLEQDAQFIIASHSPIILAFPDAVIYSFDHNPIQPVTFDQLESVSLVKSFLENPNAYLRHL